MSDQRLNLVVADARIGLAWAWIPANPPGERFQRYPASVSRDALHLGRRNGQPFRVFGEVDCPADALARLLIASTHPYPDAGVTEFRDLALAAWYDTSPVSYLARLGGIRRATSSTTPELLTVHADNALAPVCRMGTFAFALERILAAEATRRAGQPPGPRHDRHGRTHAQLPKQRVPLPV